LSKFLSALSLPTDYWSRAALASAAWRFAILSCNSRNALVSSVGGVGGTLAASC